MKYLFFDIECANCFHGTGKICEFGYILTDEQFNELERQIFIINPKDDFDWYVIKKMLAYSASTYRESPDYTYYFYKIQPLFTDKDIMIFGHTVDSDIKYLNDEANRYNLPFFNCKFYDAKYMYNTYAKTPDESFGVSTICTEMGIDLPKHEHKSVDDAYATMLIVKEICKRMNTDVYGLIDICNDCKGETNNGEINTVVREKARLKREELEKLYNAPIKNNFIKGKNKFNFSLFCRNVKPQGKIYENELTGKKLSISRNYEYAHYKQMLSIIQLLKNCGCEYCLKASESDYFVTYKLIDDDGNEQPCIRRKYVDEAIENGATIKIISIDSLLNILDITMKEIEEMPYPDESYFVNKNNDKIVNKSNKVVYSSNSSSTTIGDILKAQGIDLSEITFADVNE